MQILVWSVGDIIACVLLALILFCALMAGIVMGVQWLGRKVLEWWRGN